MAVSWYQLYVGLEPRKGEHPTVFFFLAHLSSIASITHGKASKNTLESSFS